LGAVGGTLFHANGGAWVQGTAPTLLEDTTECRSGCSQAGIGSDRCNTTQILPTVSSLLLPPVTSAMLEHVIALKFKGVIVGEEGSVHTPWRKVERNIIS